MSGKNAGGGTFDGSTHTAPKSNPEQRKSFLGFFSTPRSSAVAVPSPLNVEKPPSIPASVPQSSTPMPASTGTSGNVPITVTADSGSAVVESQQATQGLTRTPSSARPIGQRTRKDSSSLSHDEALNISRAGWSSQTGEYVGSPLSPRMAGTGAAAMARNRARSNSKYDKLGLMAAYSGGPSSF